MAQTTGTEASPEAVAAAIAENHAAAVQFPSMMYTDNVPVAAIAQRMVDGQYDKVFLISEIEERLDEPVDSVDAAHQRV